MVKLFRVWPFLLPKNMIIREDVAPAAEAPTAVKDLLMKVGGRNPFGEPNYRLNLASGVRKLQGAEWFTYRAGYTVRRNQKGTWVDEEGQRWIDPEFNPFEGREKPISVRVEMRWINAYPHLSGWIFQEWFPAHKFGSPNEWASYRVTSRNLDGTETKHNLCRLGPYPEYGKYMLVLPRGYPYVPPLVSLRDAVNYTESCRAFWAAMTPERRRRLEEDQDLEQAELLEMRQSQQDLLRIRDYTSPMLSTSLAAGRWRESLVKQAHLKIGHVGN